MSNKLKKKRRKEKVKKDQKPEVWDCAVCQKSLTASNELTYHYMNHSILELALGNLLIHWIFIVIQGHIKNVWGPD